MTPKGKKTSTRLVHAGRDADAFKGKVNPSIERASTILAKDVSGLYGQTKSLYGRMGLETHDVLKTGLCELENASHAQLAGNGLNACALALASCVGAGDHIIASDSIYGPTRRFCEDYLQRMGVETSFVPPNFGTDIQNHIRENTKVIFLEMPGSLTFELHEIDPIVEAARSRGITTIMDNTWGAGISCRPLDLGVDISVQALTKYVIGHSDGFGGAAMTNSASLAAMLQRTANDWGISMSPDDCYLAQRGLRSLALRMKTQGESSLRLAEFLDAHPSVQAVLHPALPCHPDHDLWKKYFTGTAGLFSFCLAPVSEAALNTFFETLTLFGFGFSWGGFESLIIPCDPQLKRTSSPYWTSGTHGHLIRVSVGLEDPDDIISDMSAALSACANCEV